MLLYINNDLFVKKPTQREVLSCQACVIMNAIIIFKES